MSTGNEEVFVSNDEVLVEGKISTSGIYVHIHKTQDWLKLSTYYCIYSIGIFFCRVILES